MKIIPTITLKDPQPEGKGTLAHADVDLLINPDDPTCGKLVLCGFSIIRGKNGRWVAFPSRPGKEPGQYFRVVKATGRLEAAIAKTILDAYEDAMNGRRP